MSRACTANRGEAACWARGVRSFGRRFQPRPRPLTKRRATEHGGRLGPLVRPGCSQACMRPIVLAEPAQSMQALHLLRMEKRSRPSRFLC
eukprot:6212852-Pleurochrysis_carterae.AAC.1